MDKNPYPTLKEISEAHSWKRDYERYLPLSRYLFRPPGFLLAWLTIRMGLSSEAVSWLSGLVGLLGCLFLIGGKSELLFAGILLLFFFNLLDCVDGSMARVMNTQNPYGRFLDALMAFVDMGLWTVIGIMAYRHPKILFIPEPFCYGPIFWLAVGGLACYFSIMVGYVERIFDELVRDDWNKLRSNSKSVEESESTVNTPPEKTGPSGIRGIIQAINTNLRVRETHYFLLILAYFTKTIDLLLTLFLFYYAAQIVSLIIIYMIRGKKLRVRIPGK